MIDTHVHFWNFDPIRDNWITDEMEAIRKDFLPKNLLRIYNDLQITGCIAVQASQTEEENYFLLSLAAQNDMIKGIVGWIDLRSPDLEERLKHWSSFKKIKGWRHVLQAESSEFILSNEFINGIRKLKEFNYTYDLLVYHNQLPELVQMVDQIPDQPFVLDHCGKPDVKKQDLEIWAKNIQTLAQNPLVHCKISGLLAEADWKNWKEEELFTCFDVIFEYFGPGRVMYGSDWPVMLISRPYTDWFSLVQKYTSRFSAAENNLIFFENARRFYLT